MTVAWGRDYGDVAPLNGVIFASGVGSTLEVAVDVVPAWTCRVEQVPGR